MSLPHGHTAAAADGTRPCGRDDVDIPGLRSVRPYVTTVGEVIHARPTLLWWIPRTSSGSESCRRPRNGPATNSPCCATGPGPCVAPDQTVIRSTSASLSPCCHPTAAPTSTIRNPAWATSGPRNSAFSASLDCLNTWISASSAEIADLTEPQWGPAMPAGISRAFKYGSSSACSPQWGRIII